MQVFPESLGHRYSCPRQFRCREWSNQIQFSNRGCALDGGPARLIDHGVLPVLPVWRVRQNPLESYKNFVRLFFKPVAHPRLRQQMAGFRWLGLDLLAQLVHHHAQVLHFIAVVRTPDRLQ
jgi:hypothetical protein